MHAGGRGKSRVSRKSLSLKKTKKKEVGCKSSTFGERDITKYFQKNGYSKCVDEQEIDLKTQKMKRLRKENDDKNEPISSKTNITIETKNGCSSDDIETLLNKEPSSIESNIQPRYSTSKMSSNFQCNPKQPGLMENKIGDGPQMLLSPPSWNKIKQTSVSSPCLMQGDDLIVPPTPPLKSTFCENSLNVTTKKETASFCRSNNVNVKAAYIKQKPKETCPSETPRSKLSLKRPSKNISSNCLKKATPFLENHTSKKKLLGKNLSSDEIDFGRENITEIFSKIPVSHPTFPVARKTYKLSRKFKKSTPDADGHQATPNSGKYGTNISGILSKNEDMMFGYGISPSDNENILEQSLPLFDEDDEGCELLGGRSIKRTAEKGNSPLQKRFSSEASGVIESQSIVVEDIPDENYLPQNKPADHSKSIAAELLEKVVTTPTKYISNVTPKKQCSSRDYDDLSDISMSSLNNDEICQLIDGLPWSSTNDKAVNNNRHVSPAKSYVRSKSTELNSFTSSKTNVKTTNTEEADKQGYRTLLVLEVYRREILDDVTCRTGASEKVLRLFDESNNSEKYCQLREDWERTEVEHGDIVNIVGQLPSTTCYILDNKSTNYIIVHPNILVTPTAISSSTRCLRRSILEKYFKTEGQNEVMFLGTLMHSIFEAALTSHDFSSETVLAKARELLQNLRNLTELYGLGITEEEVLAKVKEKASSLAEWGDKYFQKQPHPIHGVIDFKDGGAQKSTEENVAVCISKIIDIEECVWSPKFGLKGKVDATVEVKINKNPNIMKRNVASYETSIMPLELKTGKLYSKLGSVEHRAQVILYTLSMMDRYPNTMDTGLLVYLKEGHMLGVPAYLHEKRALVMKRNEMVRYLSFSGNKLLQNMPRMLQDERSCNYCSQLKVCTLYHKSVENGNKTSAGIGQLFDKMTNHLSAVHLEYFVHWNRLIYLESKAMKNSGHEPDVWCLSGLEREQLGYCFSNMVLESCELPSSSMKTDQFVNKFIKSSTLPVSEMHLVKGDYVVVSQEKGIIALATGFLVDISEKAITVLLDKDLTKCYHHTTGVLYRIDKAEISTGTVIQWSNLAKLFFADSEQDAKLRRLIVDLNSPSFSREKEILSSQMSCSSQLSLCFISSPEKLSQCDAEFTNIIKDLNSDQRNAINKVLTAEDYALILGMPGTGKTTTIACLVRVLITLGKTVLLTSYTHSAVDNILLKLKQSKVDFLRLGSLQKLHPEIKQYAVENAAKHVNNVTELKEFYESKLVVATTCLGVNNSVFNQRSFDYCIVDEASQITQPVCFGSLRHASIFVLVGDHYQLPPLVQSHEARDGGMDISLFKRLSETHPQAVVNLEHQYRMHKDIMLLSNSLIYDHRLKCGTQDIGERLLSLPTWDVFCKTIWKMKKEQQVNCSWLIEVLDALLTVIFVNTDNLPAMETRSGRNVFNDKEAAIVATTTRGLIKSGLNPHHIGIISPYRHQLKIIKQSIDDGDVGNPISDVEINTVDKYQGRDKQCVIVSFVRSNDAGHVGDLLRDWRRVNVALTRAKHKLILVGSEKTLKHNMLFQELLTILEKNSWVYNLPKDAWCGVVP